MGGPDSEPAIWEVYARQLFPLKHGFPVWNGHPESDGDELDLGSVIYTQGGGKYLTLFNCMKPVEEEEKIRRGIPEDHKPIPQTNLLIDKYGEINLPRLHSSSIIVRGAGAELGGGSPDGTFGAGLGFKYTTKASAGAVLVLRPPGRRQVISSKRRIVTYMRERFDSWMSLVNDRFEMDLAQDELWFISGTIKTTQWAAAAFYGESSNKEGSVDCQVGPFKIGLSMNLAAEQSGQYESNWGPQRWIEEEGAVVSSSEPLPPLKPNQCIFMNYYKMKKRFLWKSRPIAAGAGPHQLPPSSPGGDGDGTARLSVPSGPSDDGSSEFEEVPPRVQGYDPVDILLEYILEHSEAEIAIGSDRDIYAIFKDEDVPDDLKAGIAAKQPQIDVDEDGVGTVVVDLELGVAGAPSATEAEVAQPGAELAPAEDQEAQGSSSQQTEIPPPTAGPSALLEGDDDDDGLTEEEEARLKDERQLRIWLPAMNGHGGSVTSLAVSPDSKYIASGSDDTTIILWDTEDSSVVRKWESGVDIVWHIAFSPDSQRLVCSGSEGRIVVWEVEVGDVIEVLEGHTDTVHTVVWSPDGTRLASGSDDMTVRIWDAETYQEIYKLEGHNAMVTFVVFSPDSKLLASGGADYNCRIWDVETGTLKHELTGHKGMVWTAAFDPESRRIATASDDGSVRIWRVETGEELVLLSEHHGPVWVVAFTEDGKEIMSASSDGTIKICDSFSGECVLALEGHDSMVNAAEFSPDGKYIVSGSSDNTVRLWDRRDGSCLVTFNEHNDKVTHAIFSPDGRTLSSGSDDGKVKIRILSEFLQGEGDAEQ
ncbi:WD40 repeat-like protein [Lentinus tigrinus ALCF2SS1-7]|uniref:WD40 repeat-like protein n=1 Tax=Lentinus tigrinus ALCF2SS1-7 TaxID=1328758 RepID=UPI0011662B39|nr:WD40 repeat-like protein [Lentinus tigrinus ALCF2SS1-7]